MPKRYLSEEQMIFAVGGRPLSRGKTMGRGVGGGYREFQQLVKLSAKMAMVEQGWTKTDQAVYMAIVIYLMPSSAARLHYKPNKAKLKNDKVFATKAPNVDRMACLVTNALKGVVYDQPKQVVGLTVVKKFSKEPRIEVMIGKPLDFKELTYDLRNA